MIIKNELLHILLLAVWLTSECYSKCQIQREMLWNVFP